jgi:hypothetical protein
VPRRGDLKEIEYLKTMPMKWWPEMVVGIYKQKLKSNELEVVNSKAGMGFLDRPQPWYVKWPNGYRITNDVQANMKARDNVIQAQVVFIANMVKQPTRKVFASYNGPKKLSQCYNF